MAGGGAPAGGESLIPGRPVAGARHGVLALAICFRGLSLGETSEREKLLLPTERETTGRRNKNKAAWGRRGVRSTWPPAWLKTTVDWARGRGVPGFQRLGGYLDWFVVEGCILDRGES